MQKIGIVLSIIGAGLLAASPVLARELILTDKQIENVRVSCVDSQGALKRVKTSDTLLRVNLGQRYENISLRLMTPLNSRIALSGLDVVDLSRTTTNYSKELKAFSNNYRDYITIVDTALKLDCQVEPVEYYALIEQARESRANLRANTQELNRLTGQYRKQVMKFMQDRGVDE